MKKTLMITVIFGLVLPVMAQAKDIKSPKRTALTVKQAHSILIKRKHDKDTVYKYKKGYGYAGAVPVQIRRNWYCFDIFAVLPDGDTEEADSNLCVDKFTKHIFDVQPGGKYELLK